MPSAVAFEAIGWVSPSPTVVTRDGWPPQRAVAGFDMRPPTPIRNLWNVGDGVKEYANGGTTACAETAKLVVERIVERFPR